MKRRTIIIIVVSLIFSLCLARGGDGGASKTSKATRGGTLITEQVATEENQARLLKAQPPERLEWSLEREQINKRTRLWNDPNKAAYIYLIDYGKVMGFFTIKGKVSSVNSQITNPERPYKPSVWRDASMIGLPSPAEDGSYGTNGDAVYFFTTEDVYVEWSGVYMLCDQPLKMATPPALVRQVK